MGLYRGLDSEEGWIQRKFAELEARLDQQASARRLVFAADWKQYDATVSLTGAFSTFGTTAVAVPVGYTQAIVQMSVYAGTTFNGGINGVIGVQGWANNFGGPGISTGQNGGGAISVASSLAVKFSVANLTTFNIWISAYCSQVARSGDNVHLSALITFTR